MRDASIKDTLLAVLVAGLTFTACSGGDGGGGTDPIVPVATTIDITPASVTFTGLCQGQVLTAVVRDQNGNPFTSPVTWSSDDPAVASVSVGGTLTAVAPGSTTIRATSGSAAASIPVTVEGAAAPPGPFRIELTFTDCGSPSQNAAFVTAANRWMSIIGSELSDITFAVADSFPCPAGVFRHPGTVDDLRIYVSITTIDGPGNVLGSAGPCSIRNADSIPIVGQMKFDEADLDQIEAAGLLERVILHEMGHVLGIGTLWPLKSLVVNPSLPSSPGVDTHFPSALTVAAFDAAGGVNYTGGAKVPVENNAEQGSSDGHWREDVLTDELMTPTVNNGVLNPLSAISLQSLADMGYLIDLAGADPYNRVFTVAGLALETEVDGFRLVNDVYRGPITLVDSDGNLRGVIQR